MHVKKITANIKKKKNILTLKKWLDNENVYISSINGFVYRDFHEKNIKEKIYHPDWSFNERILYTIDLINILHGLKKKIKSLSISTVPISYSFWVKKKYKCYLLYKSSKNILKVMPILLYTKNIHLDIEPEPDCTLYNVETFITFFNKWLIPIAKNKTIFKTSDVRFYIRICYDICHFSVMFVNHVNAALSLNKNKIKIGKIQVSSALELVVPKDKFSKKNLLKNLLFIRKSSFLHQVTEKDGTKFITYSDIKYSIKKFVNKTNNILRIHCHTPIYKHAINKLSTTHLDTYNALKYFLFKLNIYHIEIETYTHDLLSDDDKFESIINEYTWLINIINTHETFNTFK